MFCQDFQFQFMWGGGVRGESRSYSLDRPKMYFVKFWQRQILYYQRSDTSSLKSKLREAQSTQKILAAEAEENKRKESELSKKMIKESTKAKELEQHKQDLAAQNEFLKKFLTLVSRLCLKTEVTFLLAP